MSAFGSVPVSAVLVAAPAEQPALLRNIPKRFQGTYKSVPRVDWLQLLQNDFGKPDWNALYPLNDKEQPKGMLTPRMACKLFHDGIYIIKKGDESPKFVQDLIPEIAHKQYKKKQWRKQFFEGMRRVCCRLSIGLGFKPNCVAEDVFIHAILGMSFELGWRRIDAFTESLPVSDKDKDFTRVQKLGANEAVAELSKAGTDTSQKVKKFVVESKMGDVKSWFKCYDNALNTMFDHIVALHDEDTEGWSTCSTSTAGTSQSANSPVRSHRADSITSQGSLDLADSRLLASLAPIVEETPEGLRSANSEARLSAQNLAALVESLTFK